MTKIAYTLCFALSFLFLLSVVAYGHPGAHHCHADVARCH